MRRRTFLLVLPAMALPLIATILIAADWRPMTLPAPAAAANQPTWYRCWIRVPAALTTPAEKDLFRDSVMFSVMDIKGPFTVYVNGQKIAESDAAPADIRRRFKVPKGILQKGAFNSLAIRLDPKAAAGGIGASPILAAYHDELVLDGQWEVSQGELEPTDAALQPLAKQPERAFYIESGFRPASSALNRNTEFIPGQRLSPADSLAKMKAADDLAIDLLLAEPLVAQPTHISFDERGRMWVAQYRQYPYPAGLKMISRDKYYRAKFDKVPPPPPNHDKGADIISVHEDTDGDGKFDKHKKVIEGLNMANAVVYGHGGIWVMQTPYLLFYPDKNGDDIPDGDPEVRLAGFGLEDTHSVANGLVWGPDGWLYGGQGSTTTSHVTRPGIDPPGSAGVYFEGCMVWRYHPEKKIYEIFAEGGGNTFGLDFDSEGRVYSGHNGGVTHGWYFVQRGIYLKQGVDPGKFGPPANPYSFGQLPMLHSRNAIPRFTHDIVMFEGNALPQRYFGKMFGADPLHRNLVMAERYPVGSTFETSDSGTPVSSDDIAFRPVFLANAPDGSLYIADFYEEYIAHGQNYQGQIDPTTGRIYRLRGKESKLNDDLNLSEKTPAQLVELLSHPNRWHRQTAVRLLGQRKETSTIEPLKKLLASPQTHPALEALWALYQIGQFDEPTALAALKHPAAMVRAWTIRFMGEARTLSPTFAAAVIKLTGTETDAEVRAQIASTSRMLQAKEALPLVAALLRRDEDAKDAFTPLLCWWTIESHCAEHRQAVLDLLKDPAGWDAAPMKEIILPRLMQRFAASGTNAEFLACAGLLNAAPKDEHRKQLMTGFEAAFKGRALPPLPTELAAALSKSGHASPVLRVRLGESDAVAAAIKLAGDPKAKADDRLTCVELFGEIKTPAAVPVLLTVAKGGAKESADLRKAAIASLQIYDDAAIGASVADLYAALPAEVRPAAVNLLASRASWNRSLLALVESGKAKRADVPDEIATRMQASADKAVAEQAKKLLSKPPAADQAAKRAEIDRVKKIVAAGAGDPYKGEPIFMQRCAACHTLFFKGGKVGPNLTAYQRDDLGTMLISILDPSAEIREGFRNYVVETKDGRTLSGFLADNDATIVTIRGFDGQDVRIPRPQVLKLDAQAQSLMPEGLLEGLSEQELRDFFAYLRIPQPITK